MQAWRTLERGGGGEVGEPDGSDHGGGGRGHGGRLLGRAVPHRVAVGAPQRLHLDGLPARSSRCHKSDLKPAVKKSSFGLFTYLYLCRQTTKNVPYKQGQVPVGLHAT